jgi:hypothetical protein
VVIAFNPTMQSFNHAPGRYQVTIEPYYTQESNPDGPTNHTGSVSNHLNTKESRDAWEKVYQIGENKRRTRAS